MGGGGSGGVVASFFVFFFHILVSCVFPTHIHHTNEHRQGRGFLPSSSSTTMEFFFPGASNDPCFYFCHMNA